MAREFIWFELELKFPALYLEKVSKQSLQKWLPGNIWRLEGKKVGEAPTP